MRGSAEERPRVLVVDDEQAVLESVAAVLEDCAYVECTTSPLDALRKLEARDSSFHVVCADYRMPVMNGVVLLQRVAERPEYISCLLVTGAEEYFREDKKSGYYVLLKPFSPDRLVALVSQLARVAQMKRAVGALVLAQTGRHRAVKQ